MSLHLYTQTDRQTDTYSHAVQTKDVRKMRQERNSNINNKPNKQSRSKFISEKQFTYIYTNRIRNNSKMQEIHVYEAIIEVIWNACTAESLGHQFDRSVSCLSIQRMTVFSLVVCRFVP